MNCLVRTAALVGVDARLIEVEIELTQGLPFFSIIGLPDAAVKEARYRIQAALRACALEPPHRRITINLAPAALKKDGASLDLPMALSLLVASGMLPEEVVQDTVAIGELALSGQLRPVRGAIAVAAMARELGLKRLILPAMNYLEAQSVGGLEVIAAPDLGSLVAYLGQGRALPEIPIEADTEAPNFEGDLSEVRGQAAAKRALEIAAAGGHNLLFLGNPGGGKTMLARRLPSILPELNRSEALEVTRVWSAAGLVQGNKRLMRRRPFRAPHHTTSQAGLIGGGSPVRPGEISLAHRGVLFLDELPELPRHSLESLRQPLEDRKVVIARARQVIELPADFMLVAAANPCPCGWAGHPSHRCNCSADEVFRYQRRLSGPLLDRIDLVVHTPVMKPEELLGGQAGESSATVRSRVLEARKRAYRRQACSNARQPSKKLLEEVSEAPASLGRFLELALTRLQLSARGLDRVLRVARSISDLSGSPHLTEESLAEALAYRDPQQSQNTAH